MNLTNLNDFESLRLRGNIYVDKTHHIYRLVKNGKYYLLNRPSKFGKSLLISTIKAYFEGKSNLFKGLAIEKYEKKWLKHPVLLLDLGDKTYSSVTDLHDILQTQLSKLENKYGTVSQSTAYGLRLISLIDTIYTRTRSRVVLLIDNYDKPIIDSLYSTETKNEFNSILQSLYEAIKVKDGQIEFCLMSGISKIGDSSLFGGFNSLCDISMHNDYADICGISEAEMHRYFDNDVYELGKTYRLSKAQCYERIAEMYGRYHFCENSIDVYNPYSVINCLLNKSFIDNNYLQLELATNLDKDLLDKIVQDNGIYINCSALRDSRDLGDHPLSLLYRTGILTIKEYDKEYDIFYLGFPNKGIMHHLSSSFVPFFA